MITAYGGANSPMVPVAEEGAQASERLVAFTWNLDESPEALHLACAYLATQGSFVAALQELPQDDGQNLNLALGENKLKCLSRRMLKPDDKSLIRAVDPSVVLISNDDIEVDVLGKNHEHKPELDSERRLEGLTLRSETWQNLQILGIHSWDRRSRPSEKARVQWAAIMGDVVRAFWDGGPLIVLGDLNANPWSHEISSRDGLYALRRKDWPERGSGKLSGRGLHSTPLYNPMWQLLPDRADGGQGTLFFHESDSDLRWHCVDQIIVSDHLHDYVEPPAILTKLGPDSLINGSGKPELSDHLPVQLTINIEKVMSCIASAKC